jgi:exodeoxyribonuclease V
MTIIPTNSQNNAIRSVKKWFYTESKSKQVFRLFGYAGTGKSTVLGFILDELKLAHFDKNKKDNGDCVVVATFTGKAASILRKKGIPARTIHSLIYSPYEPTEEEIKAFEEEIAEAKREAMMLSGFERTQAEANITSMITELSKMKYPQFILNYSGDAAQAKLIVLDEVSMVGEEMARDLLSFNKPILVIGDPGQLPPIAGAGAFTNHKPDFMLTEIHRQAENSPIIRLATMARKGIAIPYGEYDGGVKKLRMQDVDTQTLRYGQIICGLNSSRIQLNNIMRQEFGFDSHIPTGPEEKIICLKNDSKLGLLNGTFLELSNIVDEHSLYFSATVKDEFGKSVSPNSLRIYKGHFDDHVKLDKFRNDRDWKAKKFLTEATFGYCLTAHKSQGSQWENIVVWDDNMGRTPDDRARWLYTAITRAESGLVLYS